jgi:putative methyltransferase (TIGR04325 family)
MNLYLRMKRLGMKRLAFSLGYRRFRDFTVGLESPFQGVYPDFQRALAAIPPEIMTGYDHCEAAALYGPQLDNLLPSDYPVVYWLRKLIKPDSRIFDLGGHVGLLFYSSRKYLGSPGPSDWLICDLREIIAAGRKLANERRASGLSFTVDYARADGYNIYLASGCLQYIDAPLSQLLAKLTTLPAHLIINRLPLSDGEPFITLQNIGPVVCPYRIFNRSAFVSSLCASGYELIDIWRCAELSCTIPFHQDRTVHAYTGMYLYLRGRVHPAD